MMNKTKITALIIALSFTASNGLVFSAEAKNDKNIKQVSTQLKGGVEDYKAEYINNDWWDKFQDPVLKGYIYKAATANHDIKIAALKVKETHELVRESLGKEFPELGFGTSYARNKTSNNVGMGSFSLPSYSQNSYMFPLTVNYELDLWLKNRDRTVREAKGFEAVKFDERATYISLTTAVAAAYLNVVNLDKQIDQQKELINLRKNILDLSRINYDYGLYQATDVILAEKALTEGQSGLNDLEKQRSIYLNQLAALTGDTVDNSESLKRSSNNQIEMIKDLPQSIAGEIVKNRPDVLRSEAELQQARIDVKLARKDFLPAISLTGQFGFNSNSFSKAINWDSHIASIGVSLAETLFSGGQRGARLKAKKYRYEQMLEGYQKTILTSFQEVNDSLASLKYDQQKNSDNLSRIKSEQDNLDMINIKYQKGAISYLDTLQYKERVIALKKEQIQSKTDCLIDTLSLYKAVGGKL